MTMNTESITDKRSVVIASIPYIFFSMPTDYATDKVVFSSTTASGSAIFTEEQTVVLSQVPSIVIGGLTNGSD